MLTNTESAARQYALRQKAIALGWPTEQIVTIDTDQGQSGATAADREGCRCVGKDAGEIKGAATEMLNLLCHLLGNYSIRIAGCIHRQFFLLRTNRCGERHHFAAL